MKTIAERIKNREALEPIIDLCYAHAVNLTMAEATRLLEAERVPFAMVLTPDQLTHDPHAVASGLFELQDHHVVGNALLAEEAELELLVLLAQQEEGFLYSSRSASARVSSSRSAASSAR